MSVFRSIMVNLGLLRPEPLGSKPPSWPFAKIVWLEEQHKELERRLREIESSEPRSGDSP